jgi:hypothetical protein
MAIGALVLLAAGVMVQEMLRRSKSWVPIWCLIAITPAYMGAHVAFRGIGGWGGDRAMAVSQALMADERAASLDYRLKNEYILVAKALGRPLFGWGGWGRTRVHNDLADDISTTDRLGITAMGQHGVLDLAACFTSMLLPGMLFPRRCSEQSIASAPAVALVVPLALFMIDSLVDAFMNPTFKLVAGALAELSIACPSRISESGTVMVASGFPTHRTAGTFDHSVHRIPARWVGASFN